MKHKRVMLIGFDGATLDLIDPWIEQGKLPTLARLRREGFSGCLYSDRIPHSSVAWSSIITGKDPGNHGIYDFYTMDFSGTHNTVRPVFIGDRKGASLWSIISKHDKKVTVINVPMTFPPEPVNGMMVAGFPAPSEDSAFIYPEAVRDELDRVAAGYRLYPEGPSAETDIHGYLRHLKEWTRCHNDVVQHYAAKDDWDFFMYVFNATDWAEHFYWHCMDPSHPSYDPDDETANAILEIYQQLDAHLAQLLILLDENTTLLLLSDHGAGPLIKNFYINNWLLENGYLVLKNNFETRVKKFFMRLNVSAEDIFNWIVTDGVVGKLRKLFTGVVTEKKKRCFYKFKHIDWAKTRAYSLGYNQLHINLKGREPEGIVDAGKEYDDLREELMRRLRAIVHPEKGEAFITEIYKKEAIFSGEYLATLPDIMFICDSYRYISQGGYKIASAKIFDEPPQLSGYHRPEGILYVYGDRVRPGSVQRDVRLQDIAPTVLSLLGMGVPDDMDGRCIDEAFAEELATVNISGEIAKAGDKKNTDTAFSYSKEEEKKLTEHLEDLGYL